jgi:cytidine deaminase
MSLSDQQLQQLAATRQRAGGRIPADAVAEIVASGVTIEQLMLALIPMAKTFAIPPISNFFVGAVALGASGALYFGANYEFPGQALSFCVHGEQAATTEAISFGERGIRMIAVSAAPCGYCRQFLNELTTASELQVLLPNMAPTPLTTLLPSAFGPVDLGVTAALMSEQDHQLGLVDAPGDDAVANAALRAANASYAPYSASYSGIALQTSDGSIYTGGVAENAAFNPSMSPLEAALVTLVINGGRKYADITDAVLVEVQGAVASQTAATRDVLSAMTDVPLRVFTAAPRP